MKKAMSLTTIGYLLVALFLFLVLTFIYFGHTGFFRKIYAITDKIGITDIAKSVEGLEKNITGERIELTPEEKAAEEKINKAMDTMMSGIESCLKGHDCVCNLNIPQFPEGYALRLVNGDNKVFANVFQFKSRDYKADYDEDFQGQTGVHFVSGSARELKGTNVCLVIDLDEAWGFSDDVARIRLRGPSAGMIQLYWEDKTATFQSGTQLWATEAKSPGVIYNSERDYRIYGTGAKGRPNSIYITKEKPGKGYFCFFAERWSIDDSELIDNIKCGESKEQVR